MGKHNRYNIGDIVEHKENPILEFRIINVLATVPEKKGDYFYVCKQINGKKKHIGIAFNYQERDLNLIKKASIKVINKLLKEAVGKQEYERASQIQDGINKLKSL
ncbi:MAG: UvrB/UvrC motif-containing protein [Bacteroidetes bacterium]|nr:UvrB/UvrC motif-containing protein [Bacteroidota bacterium]